MGKRIVWILFWVFVGFRAFGQDVHFSQADANPLFLNPALAGVIPTDFRFVANHRSQWNTFTNGYKTMTASIDHGRKFAFLPNSKVGLGLGIVSDKAGDGNFGQTSFFVPISIQKKLMENKLLVSYGIQLGVGQYSFDFNKFYWGDQYDGNVYDPALPVTESFANNSLEYFDLAMGFHSAYSFSDGNRIEIGFSTYHLNNPSISFSENGKAVLPVRDMYFLSAKIPLTAQLALLPGIFRQEQNKNKEFVIGSQVQLLPASELIQDFRAGIYVRNKDAIILRTAVVYKELMIGLSYDFTFSDLTQANNGLGGFELSLTYLFNLRKAIPYYPPKYCPDFI
ncbi:MAG: PorP/SprF family type IX secretion system membrane protein [Bacteroidales bacterium]|nr:PorP/SprF family type IX secretion system membrane protein [Bacteroidales bacterium]MCF8457874.1 PorP/SprF family type IX secretion system membrane protein [Bacteroidales bacterium]